MAEQAMKGRGSAAGKADKAGGKARQQPQGTDRLKEELQSYVEARVQLMLEGVGRRMGEGARRLGEAHIGPRGLVGAATRGGGKLLQGHMPSKGGVLTSLAKSTAVHAKDAVVDKAKDVGRQGLESLKGGGAGDRTPDAAGKGLTIIEDIDVGVPVREAYDQWTQFEEFGRFAKGVVGVEQTDDTTTQWHVKVAKAKRDWRGTITEQVPDERIAWTSEGQKATTKGVVTFHPIGENLTKVLLVLRYYPKGPVERIGGLVRAQGRRARLDLKLYRTFVMMRGEATGGWRGEIQDGEVVRTPEEVEEEEQKAAEEKPEGRDEGEGKEEEPEGRDEEEEEEGEEEEEEEPEGRDEDEEEEEEEYDDEDEEQRAASDKDYASDEEDDWDEEDEEEEDEEDDRNRDDRPSES
ncbi:SRPBCC family protein [Streptomyces sp. NPDC052610]|uniref:SRPBCC family protein n=1 Tax=Streptomyces sp. NPDC052610 TaxID=3154952 RepID=UPI0034224424